MSSGYMIEAVPRVRYGLDLSFLNEFVPRLRTCNDAVRSVHLGVPPCLSKVLDTVSHEHVTGVLQW